MKKFLQFRAPDDVTAWVFEECERTGMSRAQFLRKIVRGEYDRHRPIARLVEPEPGDDSEQRSFRLRLVSHVSLHPGTAGPRTMAEAYELRDDDDNPVTLEAFLSSALYLRQDECILRLGCDPYTDRRILHSFYNYVQKFVTLELVTQHQLERWRAATTEDPRTA